MEMVFSAGRDNRVSEVLRASVDVISLSVLARADLGSYSASP